MASFELFLGVFVILLIVMTVIALVIEENKKRTAEDNVESEPVATDTHSTVVSLVYALGSTDWEARREIVSALGNIGSGDVIHPLIDVLMKDPNDQVRASAASWLGRLGDAQAVPPLIEVIDRYLKKPDGGTELAVASAIALGDVGSHEGLIVVDKLAKSFEQRGMLEERKKITHALKDIELTMDLTGKKCMVCNLPLGDKEKLVQCPICRNTAHEDHMLEWLRRSDYCPTCRARIGERQLISVLPKKLLPKKPRKSVSKVKKR